MPVAIDGGGLPPVSDAAGAKRRSHDGVVMRAPGRARKPPEAAPAAEERTATFGEVLASREYKAVFSASALSWFGDYAARAAVTALVYQQTNGSIAASAATFAISYLPWLGFGAVLSAIAERHSYRRVMVICDVARLLIMATIAMLSLPVPALMALLFVTALLNPPFDAARSAMLPQILEGDRYVVGLSLQRTISQVSMIAGYIGGAAFTAADPRGALYFNAATFGFSAIAIWFFVRERQPSLREEDRSSLLRETAGGYSVVFRNRVLRAVALVVFGAALFGAVPEGLAAAWSHELHHERLHGWIQGAIMMAGALGFILGTLVVSRLVTPSRRIKLIRPFAILTPLTLVPALFQPGVAIVVAMTVASGIALAGMLPATNGLFVQVLPPSYRARAFGVIQSGLYLLQGASVTIAGWLASHYNLEKVVGLWAVGGVVLMVAIGLAWPSSATISDAILANRIRTAAEEHAGLSTDGQEFGEDTIDLGRPSSPLRRIGPLRPAPSYFDRAESTVDLSSHVGPASSDPTVDLTARRSLYRRAAARTPESDSGPKTVDLSGPPPAAGKHRQ
jgi:MFS family permease